MTPNFAYAITCATAGPVIQQIEANRVYQKDDPTHSRIDLNAYIQNNLLVGPTRQFQRVVSRLSDSAVVEKTGVARECLLHLIRAWAAGNAFLTPPGNRQGRFVQTWVLGTVSLAIIKSRLIAEMRSDPQIITWLEGLSNAVIDTHRKRPKHNNLSDWAALAIFSAAAITANRQHINEAEALNATGLSNIDERGYLREEMRRGARSLHYHFFGGQPLYIYERVRTLVFPSRPLPDGLQRLLKRLGSGDFSDLEGRQKPAKEVGWMAMACSEVECNSAYDGSEFITRLAGRVDRLATALKLAPNVLSEPVQ